MNRAFVLPGCGQNASNYDKLNAMLVKKGYTLVPVNIDWKSGSFNQYLSQASQQVEKPTSQDLTLGFSYGGNIAMLMENNPSKIIACSAPDINNLSKRKVFDRLNARSGVKINWNEVDNLHLPQNSSKPLLVAGSQEEMYADFAKHLAWIYNSTPKIIPEAVHDINSIYYVYGLEELV